MNSFYCIIRYHWNKMIYNNSSHTCCPLVFSVLPLDVRDTFFFCNWKQTFWYDLLPKNTKWNIIIESLYLNRKKHKDTGSCHRCLRQWVKWGRNSREEEEGSLKGWNKGKRPGQNGRPITGGLCPFIPQDFYSRHI